MTPLTPKEDLLDAMALVVYRREKQARREAYVKAAEHLNTWGDGFDEERDQRIAYQAATAIRRLAEGE